MHFTFQDEPTDYDGRLDTEDALFDSETILAQDAIAELIGDSDDEDEGDSEAGPATPSYAHFKERESAGGFAPQPTVTQNYPKDGAYLRCALLSPVDLDSF